MSLFTDPGVAFQTRIFHLRDFANHMKWQYTPTVPWQSLPYAESFQLFRRGHSQTVTNVLNGMAGAVQVIIFDYSFDIDHGFRGIPIGSSIRIGGDPDRIQQRHSQTVAMFGSASLTLPLFQLHPRSLSRRFASMFTGSLDFSNHPTFAEQYFVTGPDEPAIRRLLTGPLMNALEANPGWSIEGGGGQFFFYREDQTVMPAQMQWLIETGQQVLKLMEATETAANA